LVRLRESEVDWVEAADYCVRVHAGAETHVVRGSMNAMEQQLDERSFVRIHRSVIVNLARIREVQPLFHGDHVVILTDGSRHRLPRTRRAVLERAMGISL
ncbi:MAG: LytTR family DNA-binding domain-containing protein, partial [Planctomycetota bacterium]